jgi:hypothetical protein
MPVSREKIWVEGTRAETAEKSAALARDILIRWDNVYISPVPKNDEIPHPENQSTL